MSIVVPTYRREDVLLRTLDSLLVQLQEGDELVVVDQTEYHTQNVRARLHRLDGEGGIRWIQLSPPSITRAMNRGLLESRAQVILFVDDDVRPDASFVAAHREAHAGRTRTIVAGRVLQPWDDEPGRVTPSTYASDQACWTQEFMGGNFSVRRNDALAIGGFDENFIQVAYRFEAEFAARFRASGGRIWFEPRATLHHLQEANGGTRAYGRHLTTARPSHSVGAYYFALRADSGWLCVKTCATRLIGSVKTTHHLRRPWWIPATLVAEIRGLLLARRLSRAGPKLIGSTHGS